MKFEWQCIEEKGDISGYWGTFRAKVFGGWIINNIYRTEIAGFKESDIDSYGQNLVFVPDPKHEWEIDNG